MGHIFYIQVWILAIIASLDLFWQTLHYSGLATTFGDGDFGSPETNFPIFGMYFT